VTYNGGSGISVTGSTDTVTGYPELSSFKVGYFLKEISKDGRDPTLNLRFNATKLFKDNTTAGENYEYLFNMTNSTGGDPDSTSLFNLDTLKALLQAGDDTIDIIEDIKATNDNLNLKAFDNVTKTLQLESND
jgi:hypothetical protein